MLFFFQISYMYPKSAYDQTTVKETDDLQKINGIK